MEHLSDPAPFRGLRGSDLLGHLPGALAELRRSLDELLEMFWEESCRSRVCEQAAALAEAAKLQGWTRISTLARTLVSICFITRREALPIRRELAEKLHELMALLEESAAEGRGQRTG